MGCPWAQDVIAYCRGEFEQQLNRYVYPQSGWTTPAASCAGEGIDFQGEVGCVVRAGGRAVAHAIRCVRLGLR